MRRWRPAILHNGLVVFATALLYGHLFSQLRQGLINRLASPEREGQSPLKLFHPISWIWLEKFSKCGDRGLRADGRAGAQNERMQVRWRRTRRGASGSGLPLLAPSAPRGPPAASRVAEPPAQHGSRAAEPRGRPSTPGSGAGEERGGGARAAGPPGAGETAAAALVRLRARCFLSLGGCGLTPPPVPRSERERGGKKKKRKKKDFY